PRRGRPAGAVVRPRAAGARGWPRTAKAGLAERATAGRTEVSIIARPGRDRPGPDRHTVRPLLRFGARRHPAGIRSPGIRTGPVLARAMAAAGRGHGQEEGQEEAGRAAPPTPPHDGARRTPVPVGKAAR